MERKRRTWTYLLPVTAIALLIAACTEQMRQPTGPGPSPGTPSYAATVPFNSEGSCLAADAFKSGFTSGIADSSDTGGSALNCTSNDIRIARADVKSYSTDGINFTTFTGQPVQCNAGTTIFVNVDAILQETATSERTDIGVWIATDGGNARTGTCNHYNLNNLNPAVPGVSQIDGDQCGDMNNADSTRVALGVLELTCNSAGTTDSLHVGSCLAWTQPGGDQVCPVGGSQSADAYRFGTVPGTKSKCNCDGFNFPIIVNRSALLEVRKACVPTNDAGKFNLQIDAATVGTGANASCGGTTGIDTVSAGTSANPGAVHSFGETAGTATSLGDYTSSRVCVNRSGGAVRLADGAGTGGSLTLQPNDDVICTITNSRKPVLKVTKILSPTSDAGKFDFSIGGTSFNNSGAGYGNNGTTGFQVVTPGAVTVSESGHSGTTLGDYTSVLSCSKTVSSNTGTSGSVTAAAGDSITCTFTNTFRSPVIRVAKVTVPTTDAGKFDFTIGGNLNTNSGAGYGNGQNTGYLPAAVGPLTVSESGHSGTSLTAYTSVLECSKTVSSNTGTSGSVTVAAGDTINCTFTNTRKPVLKVTKMTVPTNDAGRFDLSINATTFDNSGAGYGNTGTTGFQVIPLGVNAVSEAGHSGTSLSAYDSQLSCSKTVTSNTGTAGSITAVAGDSITCTFTNSRKPVLRVSKVTVPTTDPGKFDFNIGANAFTNSGAGYGNGQGTGYQTVGTSATTVSEAGHTGTSLTNYVSQLSCSKTVSSNTGTSGSVTPAYGDSISCTFTNSRKAVLIVEKEVVGGGTQSFDFSQTGISQFALTNGQSKKTVDILPGDVTVCELALAVAWNLTVTQNGSPVTPDIDGTSGDGCVTVTLAYGDSTTLHFTNTPPPGGGTRTIGYWKNWSSCSTSNGKQYDKAIAKGTPEATLDFYLGAGSSIYPLGDITSLTCAQAVNLLSKSAIDGSKRAGDPVYNMVAQLLGAKLNVAANAGTCATLLTALADAQAYLDGINFVGTGSYKGLSGTDLTNVNTWAGIFGSYNEGTLGGGCPTHI